MDPISTELLTALAGGVGGEAARQAWAWLRTLVGRPAAADSAIVSGEAELDALEQAPADVDRAQALSTTLAQRAAVDPDFRTGLERWYQQIEVSKTGDGDVHIEISGNPKFYGPVLQGRDFSGVSFGSPPASPSLPPEG
ncbi:hypothetical protein OG594_35845 [Streptomyces sp. NBC_01214]|uniref:hypothetical protein n=1 Tax=Streptomyces sp. NBC_01214 TaxID=2903777 RepID=UPI002251ECF0|nr:hypothetical protein [Streptomyces sp. NBC_01214]MCX4806935.1 hypothetical protein [Streptomyces sp. NBC_01214]